MAGPAIVCVRSAGQAAGFSAEGSSEAVSESSAGVSTCGAIRTSTLRGFACSANGIDNFSTPFSYSALTCSRSSRSPRWSLAGETAGRALSDQGLGALGSAAAGAPR